MVRKFLIKLRFILELFLSAVLYYSGLLFLIKKIMGNHKKTPILLYHEIGKPSIEVGDIKFFVNSEFFKKQIKYLAENYNVISMETFLEYRKNGMVLPKNSLLITFDGGYVGTYQNAYPLLLKYNLPFIVYLITEVMGEKPSWEFTVAHLSKFLLNKTITINFYNQQLTYELKTAEQRNVFINEMKTLIKKNQDVQREIVSLIEEGLSVDGSLICKKLFLDWNHIKEMENSGLMEIGSHTMNHLRLTSLKKEDLEKEIIESKNIIEKFIGKPVLHFCYPDGFFSEKIKKLVESAGYQSATAVTSLDDEKGCNTASDDNYELKRIFISNQPFICIFAMQVSGVSAGIRNILKKY